MLAPRDTVCRSIVHFIGDLIWGLAALAVVLTASADPALAQPTREFHRTLAVTANDPVTLDVGLSKGELYIAYGRDDQVSIAAIVQVPAGANANTEVPDAAPSIEQNGNHLRIRELSRAGLAEGRIKIVWRIDVPYRTEVDSLVENGKQTITGIMGPVKAGTRKGDIKVSYVSKGVTAEAGSGDLDLEVIGERAEARTGNGNISCIRVVEGAKAVTEKGDIVFMVVGPSQANVKTGNGRIEVGGARSSFSGSTAGGDLHVKAIPHGDWQLNSVSGNIRVELPPAARFEVKATTNAGEVLVDRDDMPRSIAEARHVDQKVNGGGRHIEVHTETGNIAIR
ncbi:MAG: DUF4097 family beta strand repeat-containing protein [Terriglobia bacterium]